MDILIRLKNASENARSDVASVCDDAAKEIERYRSALRELNSATTDPLIIASGSALAKLFGEVQT